jgi:hypothetical protein
MRKLLLAALAVGAMGIGAAGCTLDDTYASCIDTADCNDLDDQCYGLDIPAEATSGNFCTRECSSDLDCEANFGFEGVCRSFDGSTNLCHQRCIDNTDCYSTSVCIAVFNVDTGVDEFLCVPDN